MVRGASSQRPCVSPPLLIWRHGCSQSVRSPIRQSWLRTSGMTSRTASVSAMATQRASSSLSSALRNVRKLSVQGPRGRRSPTPGDRATEAHGVEGDENDGEEMRPVPTDDELAPVLSRLLSSASDRTCACLPSMSDCLVSCASVVSLSRLRLMRVCVLAARCSSHRAACLRVPNSWQRRGAVAVPL
jgi:hypothetical protein